MSARPVDADVRGDVSDVLVRYASGIDQRDWALLRSCFTEDCDADYGDIGAWRDELVRADEGWRIARRRYTTVHLDLG